MGAIPIQITTVAMPTSVVIVQALFWWPYYWDSMVAASLSYIEDATSHRHPGPLYRNLCVTSSQWSPNLRWGIMLHIYQLGLGTLWLLFSAIWPTMDFWDSLCWKINKLLWWELRAALIFMCTEKDVDCTQKLYWSTKVTAVGFHLESRVCVCTSHT